MHTFALKFDGMGAQTSGHKLFIIYPPPHRVFQPVRVN